MTAIHTLVFADQEASWWGMCWLPAEGGSGSLAWHGEGSTGLVAAELRPAADTGPWRLEGDQVSLAFTASGPPGRGGSAQSGIESGDRLCEVSGTLTVDGHDQEIDCLGWRARTSGDFQLREIDSFRQTYGWFDETDGLGLVALRPRKSRGHDADLIASVVLEPEPAPQITDPRLSSTYDASGDPARVGLELWFEEEEPLDESEHTEERRFPRRVAAAGEAIGDTLTWQVEEFQLRGLPLRWHSHGRDGVGAYLLGRRD